MRIAVIANGRSVHTRRWCASMVERGHEVHLFTVRESGVDGVVEHVIRGPALGLGGVAAGYARMGLGLRRRLRALKPDVVHAHYATTNGVTAALAGVRPLVLFIWGTDVEGGGEIDVPLVRDVALRRVFRRCDLVLSTSAHMARVVRHQVPDPVSLEVVPWGVDLDAFRPRIGPRREGPLRLGFIKTFRELYAPGDLIDAFARIAPDHPDVTLRMAGGGPLLDAMRDRVAERGLSERIELPGPIPRDTVPDALRDLDVLVNCSVMESYGVVILEAAACGIPSVVTDVGGVHEVCVADETCLLVPPGDVGALARALDRLIRDAALRERMGAAGRALAERVGSWDHTVDTVLDRSERLVSRRPAPGAPGAAR